MPQSISRKPVSDLTPDTAFKRQSRSNPFRSGAEVTTDFVFTLNGQRHAIPEAEHTAYNEVFVDNAEEVEFISDQAAARLLRNSGLSQDILGELWEIALTAKYPHSSVVSDSKSGFLLKGEFYILLFYLRQQLEISVDSLTKLLVQGVENPTEDVIRSNPFGNNENGLGKQATLDNNEHDGVQSSSSKQQVEIAPGQDTTWEAAGNEKHLNAVPNDEEFDEFEEYSRMYDIPFFGPISQSGVSSHREDVRNTSIIQSSSLIQDPRFQGDRNLPKDMATLQSHTSVSSKIPLGRNSTKARAPIGTSRGRITSPTHGFSGLELAFGGQESDVTSQDSGKMLAAEPGPYASPGLMVPSMEELSLSSGRSNSIEDRHEAEAPSSNSEWDKKALNQLWAIETPKPPDGRRKSQKDSKTLRILRRKSSTQEQPRDVDVAENGFTLQALAQCLEKACADGNLDLVKSFLSLGANVNYRSVKQKQTHKAIDIAAANLHQEVVDYLILWGARRDAIQRALYTACFYGHVDLAIHLIDTHRANIYANPLEMMKDLESEPPFYSIILASVTNGENTRLRLLDCFMRQSNFEVNRIVAWAYDQKRDRMLSFGILSLYAGCSLDGAQTLLLAGAEVNPSNSIRPISCIKSRLWKREPETALAMLKLLVEHKSEVRKCESFLDEKEDVSPLARAVVGGSIEGAALLLEHGAQPDVGKVFGTGTDMDYTMLGYAAKSKRLDIVQLLVAAGADLCAIAHKGQPAAYLACCEGDVATVKYLFNVGGVRPEHMEACLTVSVERLHPDITTFLLENDVTVPSSIWPVLMQLRPSDSQHDEVVEVTEILLSRPSEILMPAIQAAVRNNSVLALRTVLERRHGRVDFDLNDIVPGTNGNIMAYAQYYAKHCDASSQVWKVLEFFGWEKKWRWIGVPW